MIKRATILLLCALLMFPFFPPPAPVQAAIAQTATATQAESNANPVTMAFDCNGGDLLVVGICTPNNPRAGGAPTYNAVAMTDSGEGVVDSGEDSTVELWYLVNPAAGSNNISIPNATPSFIVPIASAWSGVDTADPLDVTNSDSDTNAGNTNPSVAVTTTAANELIIDVMMEGEGTVPVTNSHTFISSQDNGGDTSNAQYTLDDGTGGLALTWTLAGQDDWAMIVASFNPAGAPPAGDIEALAGVTYATDIEAVAGVTRTDIQSIAGVDGQ